MELPDIVKFLTGLGFKDLKLIKNEEGKPTFSFASMEEKRMRAFGEPTVAAGKVLVYTLPEIGKIGISPAKNLLRFIPSGTRTVRKALDTHLGHTQITPELELMWSKAVVSSGRRLSFMTSLFEFFNVEKFQGRLPEPKFLTSDKPPQNAPGATNPRGIYYPGSSFTAGRLWMATFIFNARLPFFLEIFLHELCHEAAWVISKDRDRSQAGHGKTWQHWMTHVGLDPRRFDPTEEDEYMTSDQKAKMHEELSDLGTMATDSAMAKLQPLTYLEHTDPCWALYKGRLLKGTLTVVKNKPNFTFKDNKGNQRGFQWKAFGKNTFFRER